MGNVSNITEITSRLQVASFCKQLAVFKTMDSVTMNSVIMNSVIMNSIIMDIVIVDTTINTGLEKSGYQVNIFLFLHEKLCCRYSLEAPQ